MLKSFPIDFIRQIIVQTLEEEHYKEPMKYFGGSGQVNLFSFYEQLEKEEEVNRFVELYRDLTEQQNRTGIIANGVIVAPENPTFTNINQKTIVSMDFSVNFRTTLENRDMMLDSINRLFEIRKGRKVDIAQFDNGKLLVVGTIANNVNGTPLLRNGDYIGEIAGVDVDAECTALISAITNNSRVSIEDSTHDQWYYVKVGSYLKVVYYDYETDVYSLLVDNGNYQNIIFPPEHNSFEKWKVSISFDSQRVDTPITTNAKEYCKISFGGSASVVNSSIRLGNDLTKLSFTKYGILTKTNITFSNAPTYWLEPLEMPSGNNPNIIPNQLASNKFIPNTHTDSVASNIQYSFVCDEDIALLSQWYDYGRYGTSGITVNDITPNLLYDIVEIYSSWGNISFKSYRAKLTESIDIENTEGDVITLSINVQPQGSNNYGD